MRPIDIEQAFAVCRDAADLMAAAATHPDAQISPATRRELLAIATAILARINQPAEEDRNIALTSFAAETAT